MAARKQDRSARSTTGSDGDTSGTDGGASGGAGRGTPLPDAEIVFSARLTGDATTELYTVRPDGSQLTRLSSTAAQEESFPRWSPDREHIAYIVDRQLYVIAADGATNTLVASSVGRDGLGIAPPAWSPDGTQIVYPYPASPHVVDDTDESGRTVLHLVNADGSQDTVVSGAAALGATNTEPAWSSSGRLTFKRSFDCPDCSLGRRSGR